MKVLFVCLGNICRSPTAEGVFRQRVEQAGLSQHIDIDSAGTSDWHIDKAPDHRSQTAASQRGYDLSPLRGRQAIRTDFEHYDYILAMDNSNLADLRRLAPADYAGHLGLFLHFAENYQETEVPDPYYGGSDGFNHVLDLIEDAAEGLLRDIRQRL